MGRTGDQGGRHCIMNDYLLRILMRQRHEQILAEVRSAQLSQTGHSRVTRSNRSIRLFRSFFAQWKKRMVFQPLVTDERKCL